VTINVSGKACGARRVSRQGHVGFFRRFQGNAEERENHPAHVGLEEDDSSLHDEVEADRYEALHAEADFEDRRDEAYDHEAACAHGQEPEDALKLDRARRLRSGRGRISEGKGRRLPSLCFCSHAGAGLSRYRAEGSGSRAASTRASTLGSGQVRGSSCVWGPSLLAAGR
jgi:hypothetical protein